MCSFMSLGVVNLDNRPFYNSRKTNNKKAEAEARRTRESGGWMDL